MHFGEYELSPSLIGLSLLPSPHPEAFQRLLSEVLFTFPSRYWSAIGLSGVFSLAGWSRRIHAGFLVSRATQDAATLNQGSCTQLSCSMAALSRAFHSPDVLRWRGPTTPHMP